MDDLMLQVAAEDNIQPIATAKSKRMADRIYRFTVTYPDGNVETLDASPATLQRIRNFYRTNKPEAKVVWEEVQTSVTSNGQDYTELTFEPIVPSEGMSKVKITEGIDPKDNVQHTIAWELFSDVPPAYVPTKLKPTARDIINKGKAEAKRTAIFNKANAKPQEDRKLRIYSNDTGMLIFCGEVKDGIEFMRKNKVNASNSTIYPPKYIEKKFFSYIESKRQVKLEAMREARAAAKAEAKDMAKMMKEGK